MFELRSPRPEDTAGVYAVCFETSSPAPGADPLLVGHIFAGPYLAKHPDLARVVVDELGVAGYILGCPDSRAFERWCAEHWFPALQREYPLSEASPADADFAAHLHHPPRAPDDLVADFAAHLHIDLLPRTQGSGFGRTLIEWLCEQLAGRGIPGVHLGVSADNANAIAFYTHLGFATHAVDAQTTWMTRALAA